MLAGLLPCPNLPARWSVGTLRTLVNEAPISPADDLGYEAARLLRPVETYRKMALATIAGLTLLGLIGWAAVRMPATIPADVGYDLMATAEGTIAEVAVKEGQQVRKGDLLVLLDDSAEQQAWTTARAELDSLAQEAQTSGIAVAMPPGIGMGGQIVQMGPMPRGSLPKDPAPSKLGTLPPVTETDRQPTSQTGTSIKAAAEENVRSIELKLEGLKTEKIEVAQKRDDALNHAIEAQRNAEASKVITEQRKKQSDKMKSLLAEGVVSRVEAVRAESLYLSSQGGTDAAQKLADEQHAIAKAHEAEIVAIDSRFTKLEGELVRAKDLVAKAPAETAAPPSSIAPTVDVRRPEVPKPAFVRSTPLPSTPTKVEIDKGAKREVDGLLAEAKRKVDDAEKRIESRRILAPRDGVIVRVLVKPGNILKHGQSILVIRFSEPVQKASK